jgi:4-hydroxy-tetrahydrodipicolinate reductase
MSRQTRILLHGASGRMGQTLLRLALDDARLRIVAAVSRSGQVNGIEVDLAWPSERLADCPPFDVAIDFSLPAAFDPILALCVQRGCALVSGTTGLSPGQREAMQAAANSIPMCWASNFSLGVAVLEDLVARAAVALPDWPARIVETHHVHKLDAPSGTALTLARASEAVTGRTVAIESRREGEVIGDHVFHLQGPGEALELSHRAATRDIFAAGALETARRLEGKEPGMWRVGALLFDSSKLKA